MKHSIFILLPISLLISCTTSNNKTNSGKVVVCIDNGITPMQTKEVSFTNGITALEALQNVATVETHPVGKRVFVSAIDSISNIRGIKAWYYKVNGVSAKKLAINNPLQNTDTVCWVYKEDVCSKTVDRTN